MRYFLLPYLSVSCLRFFILVAEGVLVATEGIVYDYLIFDIIQSSKILLLTDTFEFIAK